MSEIAQVAKVLEDGSVVVNRGANDGVADGQSYLIFTPGEEVRDPETGEDLGRIEIVKGRGKVIHTQERLAIIRMDRPDHERTKTLSEIMATLSGRDEEASAVQVEVGDHARLEGNATTD